MASLQKFLAHKAYNMRVNSLQMTTRAGSGHPTSALSAADIVAVLFFDVMSVDYADYKNPSNDRFILSKGHASPILYAVYKELGILSEDQLMTYRDFNSSLEGHPTPRFAWTEAATGSLGQGLSIGVGMALSAKIDNRTFHTYVLMGDSEVAEGSIWEAAELAAYYKLNNLIGIIDVNRLGQTQETMEGWKVDDYAAKFRAFGWQPITCDGHNVEELIEVFDLAKKEKAKPAIIIAKTIKGYGIQIAANKNGFHGKAFSKDELAGILIAMADQFHDSVVPVEYKWKPKVPKLDVTSLASSIKITDPDFCVIGDEVPTRKAFGKALLQLGKQSEQVVSLDGEVMNSTYAEYFADEFPKRFVQSFIAEQNMIGMAIGMQKRGKIPFVSTFGAFFARAYDQIRMGAIGRAALRLVGSHAGVSIGQDGPSQMGLEDIALMRAIPDSKVFYPCDGVSAWKLTQLMATIDDSISYLRTTRMATPVIYDNKEVFKIGGCKVLKQGQMDKVCVIAAGVTVFEALKAYEELKKSQISISIIDLYSIKPMDVETLKEQIKKSGKKAITVEDHYLAGGMGEAVVYELKNEGFTFINLCVDKMPRSGKPQELLEYEGIDAAAILRAVKKLL